MLGPTCRNIKWAGISASVSTDKGANFGVISKSSWTSMRNPGEAEFEGVCHITSLIGLGIFKSFPPLLPLPPSILSAN